MSNADKKLSRDGKPRAPWDRRRGENDVEWRAFKVFLNVRNKKESGQRVGRSYSWARTTAKKWSWCDRVAAYDNWQNQVQTRAEETEIERVTKEHFKITDLLRQVSLTELRKLLRLAEAAEEPVVHPKDLRGIAKDAIQQERLILGEATDRPEVRWDLSGLSAEEIRILRKAKAKAGVSE